MHTLTILPRESYLRHRWNKDGICERCGFDGASCMLWMQSDEAKAYHDSRFPTCGEEMMESKLKQAARQALAQEIKEAIQELSGGRNFPDLLEAVDKLAALSHPEPEAAPHPTITEPYTLDELRAKIASHDYSAELLLQHAMLLLDRKPEAVQVPQGLVPGWNWLTHPDWNDGELTPAWVEIEGSEAWYSPAEVQNLTQFSWAERDESWEIAAAPQPPAQAEPDQQLCTLYGVDGFPALVAAMERHIERLQAKLPKHNQAAITRVREG